jgi:putative ATP-binding cassette transporter
VTLLECIRAEAAGEQRRILVAANVAGITNVLILASINASAHDPAGRELLDFVAFILLLALYAGCARYSKRRITALIEAVLHRIKVRVGNRVEGTELAVLERVRAAEICDVVTQNATLISDRGPAIAGLAQSLVIMAFSAVYIAWLSLPAFALVALVCAVGAAVFVGMRRDYVAYNQRSAMIRVTFLERLMDLLAGFKEIQFSRQRGREVREDVLQASEELRSVAVRASDLLADGMLVGEAVRFALLAAVVFTLHSYIGLDARTLTHIVAAVMFLWGPFMGAAAGIMPYARSNLALTLIFRMEKRLEQATREGVPVGALEDPWRGHVARIEARQVEYAYEAEDGGERFRVGPLDLTIAAGELLFIVGGNGSGKSTLLKVLTGLYEASAGELRVDGVPLRRENVHAYRDMVSAIFADFHLFARLYGLTDVDDGAASRLLVEMQLADKTSVVDRSFTSVALSTGQRKRLAMIVALLEARTICVFDEWAADQDPEFREYFYDRLLPRLRAQGKIVVVVSHDDRYFGRADRVVKMEDGQLRVIAGAGQGASP